MVLIIQHPPLYFFHIKIYQNKLPYPNLLQDQQKFISCLIGKYAHLVIQ